MHMKEPNRELCRERRQLVIVQERGREGEDGKTECDRYIKCTVQDMYIKSSWCNL